jgi:hypothetical protein
MQDVNQCVDELLGLLGLDVHVHRGLVFPACGWSYIKALNLQFGQEIV